MAGVSELRDRVVEVALGAGLDRVGVCCPDPFPEVAAELVERRSSGLSGGLGFTFSRPDEATDIRRTFGWAVSLVVGASAYLPEAGSPGRGEMPGGRVARFATEDHYLPLRTALDGVAAVLHAAGHRAEVMIDDSRLVDRAVAVRAGIGWWGKNSMVLAPAIGPWFLIGSVVTDAALPNDDPMRRDCGTCDACLPACPTGALVAPGVLDARLCLAAVLQQKGAIPVALRPAVEDRIYGCDDCLEACPPGARLLERSRTPMGRHDVRELIGLDNETLVERFAHFYIPGRNARYLRRNLLVVLGNTGDAADVPLLTRELVADEPLLRSHAAWALGRIGGTEAHEALRDRLTFERDAEVVEEIRAALDQSLDEPIAP